MYECTVAETVCPQEVVGIHSTILLYTCVGNYSSMRLIFLLLALLASAANAAVLSTQGNQIVNEGGQVVRITGVSLFKEHLSV